MLVRQRSIESLLGAIAKAHVIVFAFIAVSTEILSSARLIDFPHLLGAWSLLCLGCILAIALTKPWRNMLPSSEPLRSMSPASILLTGAIAIILASTFLTAILYPPNNWDSMTYHMARVAHWISNGSVAFYPTAIDRQNWELPLAEFAIMHLQLLAGSDLFANLVQWACFLVSITLSASITAELGLNKRAQLISSVITATIPMAILQSSSTQNDLVASSFILSFVLFMLRLRTHLTRENIMFAALSLGLAILTKGTAYIYCGALGMALAIPILFQPASNRPLVIRRIGCLSLVVLTALCLNIGHFSRTFQLYGTPLSSGTHKLWNQSLSARALLSNIPKNLSAHCATPSDCANLCIYRAFRFVLGKQLDNPDTTWAGNLFSISYCTHEDGAGNPVHMLLTLFAFASFLFLSRKQQLHANCYVAGVLVAGILFCVCFKWQPWASRLHTPFFALSAPVILLASAHYAKGAKRYVALIMLAVVMFQYGLALPFAFNNQTRSLLSGEWRSTPRIELYFTNGPYLYESYTKAMRLLEGTGVKDVGIYLGGDDWEYPFWTLARAGSYQSDIRFHHVGVRDLSGILQTETRLPEYVIATRNTDTWDHCKEYAVIYSDENVRMLRRIPFVANCVNKGAILLDDIQLAVLR